MYCKKCGAQIEDGKFCSECGITLDSIKNKKASVNETKKLKDWESIALLILIPGVLYYFLGGLFAVAGLIIAVIYVLHNDRQSKEA